MMEIQKRQNELQSGIKSAESLPVAKQKAVKQLRIVKLEKRIAPSSIIKRFTDTEPTIVQNVR